MCSRDRGLLLADLFSRVPSQITITKSEKMKGALLK